MKASVIPKYKKFDAYMKACNRSGALADINEYDRLAEILSKQRDLSFEVDGPFTQEDADNPSYKGAFRLSSAWTVIFKKLFQRL